MTPFLKPAFLAADTAYGSADTLNWIVNQKNIAPHIPVIDKSKREDGTFSREDFRYDRERNIYICPAGKVIPPPAISALITGFVTTHRCLTAGRARSSHPNMPSRRIVRDVNEDARDVARALAKTDAFEQSRRDRKRAEMLFAHLKRILRLARLRLRGPCGAQDEFTLAAIAQNLRRLARPPPAVPAASVA